MKRTAQFFKVSPERFFADWKEIYPNACDTEINEIYSSIILPKRATSGSAGYDFFMPEKAVLRQGKTITVPTGIRVKIDEGWVLKIYPRSSLGFRHRIQLDNTVGIIDSDYFYADNEGHIKIKITNDSKGFSCAQLEKGKGFAQGIFVEYGITFDDDARDVRTGGFGSTD